MLFNFYHLFFVFFFPVCSCFECALELARSLSCSSPPRPRSSAREPGKMMGGGVPGPTRNGEMLPRRLGAGLLVVLQKVPSEGS